LFNQIKLYGAIVLAMIFWSVSFIWTRVAILSFHPVTLITLRLLLASILLFIVSFSIGKFQRLRREDIKWFVLLAFFEPFMYYIGETYGLTMVESTLASVIVSTIPLFAPVLAYFLLKEKIGWANILGIFVSLFGVFLVIYQPGGGFTANPGGIALMFMAVFSAISYTTVLRKISTHYSTLNVIFYQSFIGLFFFIPTFFIVDFPTIQTLHVTTQAFTALIMLAVFASVIAFVLFAGVVRKIGVARTNVFVNLIPVFTALFAWLFMGDIVTWIKWIGIGIVVFGLFISQIGKMKFKIKLIRGPQY
jgi:drug/metabolite transporter (DMT)-like permease